MQCDKLASVELPAVSCYDRHAVLKFFIGLEFEIQCKVPIFRGDINISIQVQRNVDRKTRSICLAVSMQYGLVTDRQTQSHGIYRTSIVSCG